MFPPEYHSPENQKRRAVERWEKERVLNGPLNVDLIEASGKSDSTFYRHKKFGPPIKKPKPWVALVISKATFYRRKKMTVL